MKTLLLLRHGKAEEGNAEGDRERALTSRGKADVAKVSEQVAAQFGSPDLIVTSDARRARQTAKVVARTLGYTGTPRVSDSLYGADWQTILQVIRTLPDEVKSALLVGHNPGFFEIGSVLAAEVLPTMTLPTAGVIWLELPVNEWRDVERGTAVVHSVLRPEAQ